MTAAQAYPINAITTNLDRALMCERKVLAR